MTQATGHYALAGMTTAGCTRRQRWFSTSGCREKSGKAGGDRRRRREKADRARLRALDAAGNASKDSS